MIGTKNGEVDAVKIGISIDPQRRIVEMQSGNPHELVVLFSVEVDSSDVYKIESHCHRELKHSQLTGEWFSVSADEAIDFVQEVVNEQLWRKIAKPRVERARVGHQRTAMKGRPFVLRMPDELTARIEDWRAARRPVPSRGDAIRQLVALALDAEDAASGAPTHQT